MAPRAATSTAKRAGKSAKAKNNGTKKAGATKAKKAGATKAKKAGATKAAKSEAAKTKKSTTATPKAKKAKVAKKASKSATSAGKKSKKSDKSDKSKKSKKGKKKKRIKGDPLLFAPLSEGERADALRIMTNDRRLASMTAVGRYRIIAVEPLVLKPPSKLASHRLARVVAYDYAADRSVHAAIDLDDVVVAHLSSGLIQPMLAREEEEAAISIAMASEQVKSRLGLGDQPQVAMHYWGVRESDISHRRRSAAVLFGQPSARPSLVAVVDLLDSAVVDVVPAEQW